MNNNVNQCMNIMKSTLNTCSFCHKGPTPKANHQKKPNPYKNLTQKKKKEVIPTPMMKIPTKSTKLSKIQSKDPKQ